MLPPNYNRMGKKESCGSFFSSPQAEAAYESDKGTNIKSFGAARNSSSSSSLSRCIPIKGRLLLLLLW